MEVAYIGIGSNLGDRGQWLHEAQEKLRALSPKLEPVRKSGIYQTPAVIRVGVSPQEEDPEHIQSFLNIVVEVRTSFEPEPLLDEMLKIERQLGRKRDGEESPWTPGHFRQFRSRNIDLDLLFYGDRVVNTQKLTVPHPRVHRRSFALLPLRELNKDLVHPVLWKSIEELCDMPLEPEEITKWKG
jgi:2-amino-4-hydroxy-6-hydroxymethyldihydropteridine diphosphokinase